MSTNSDQTAVQSNGDSGGGGSSSSSQQPRFFQIWGRAVRHERNASSLNLFKAMILVTAILWIWLPFFWGSTWLQLKKLSNLTIAAVNLEGADGAVGPVLVQMAQQTNSQPPDIGRLGFDIQDASDYPGGIDDVRRSIKDAQHWGAIVVLPNCTTTWSDALQSGNASYDPTGCMAIFFSGARFYQIIIPYLLPSMKQTATQVANRAASQAVSQWIQQNAGTDALVSNAAAAPQAISPAFAFFEEDLSPIGSWAIAAPFEAALIYFIVLLYPLALWGYMARQRRGFHNKVSFPSLVLWRLGVSAFCYFWLSLAFTTLFVAFQIPYRSAFGGGGFVVLWILNFLGLTALGWALENATSILTPQFLPYALISLIVLDLTSSFTPLELAHRFYQFCKWVPFYHLVEGYKIITHSTYPSSQIAVNFGALLGVSGVNILFMLLGVWMEQHRGEKAARQKQEEAESKKQEQEQ